MTQSIFNSTDTILLLHTSFTTDFAKFTTTAGVPSSIQEAVIVTPTENIMAVSPSDQLLTSFKTKKQNIATSSQILFSSSVTIHPTDLLSIKHLASSTTLASPKTFNPNTITPIQPSSKAYSESPQKGFTTVDINSIFKKTPALTSATRGSQTYKITFSSLNTNLDSLQVTQFLSSSHNTNTDNPHQTLSQQSERIKSTKMIFYPSTTLQTVISTTLVHSAPLETRVTSPTLTGRSNVSSYDFLVDSTTRDSSKLSSSIASVLDFNTMTSSNKNDSTMLYTMNSISRILNSTSKDFSSNSIQSTELTMSGDTTIIAINLISTVNEATLPIVTSSLTNIISSAKSITSIDESLDSSTTSNTYQHLSSLPELIQPSSTLPSPEISKGKEGAKSITSIDESLDSITTSNTYQHLSSLSELIQPSSLTPSLEVFKGSLTSFLHEPSMESIHLSTRLSEKTDSLFTHSNVTTTEFLKTSISDLITKYSGTLTPKLYTTFTLHTTRGMVSYFSSILRAYLRENSFWVNILIFLKIHNFKHVLFSPYFLFFCLLIVTFP